MVNVLEALKGLTYAELQVVDKSLADLKRQAREDGKEAIQAERDKVVIKVNNLIRNTELTKGSTILLTYRGKVVSAEVITVPTENSRNLKVQSDDFTTKDGTRYAEKHTFLELVQD